MSTKATSKPLIRTDRFSHSEIHRYPSLRPKFCIRRPNGQIVPLIALDELPHWLLVVATYPMALTEMELISNSTPRVGEYDTICLFCESTLKHVIDDISWARSKRGDLDQYMDALMGREYPPHAYPTSYYEQAHPLHHWDAMERFLRPDTPESIETPPSAWLNPEANEFTPSANNTPANTGSPQSQALPSPTPHDPLYWTTCKISRLYIAPPSPPKALPPQ